MKQLNPNPNPDRDIIISHPTTTVQLGSHQDNAEENHSSVSQQITAPIHKESTFEKFTLDEVLSREYQIRAITWTNSQSRGSIIDTFVFPGDLFSQAFIKNKLSYFKYFRGGIEISFKVNASKYFYGSLLAFYNPMPNVDEIVNLNPSLNNMSSYPHVLISASNSGVITLRMPFLYNQRFLDLSNYVSNTLSEVKVAVLNPLIDITGSTSSSVNVLVTARFIDAEAFLPLQMTLQSKMEGVVKSTNHSTSDSYEIGDSEEGLVYTSKASISNMEKILHDTVRLGCSITGLDKPTSTDATAIIKLDPFHGMTNGKGIEKANKFSVDPENNISTYPNVTAIEQDEMAFKNIISKPTLILTTDMSFLTDSVVGPHPFNLNVFSYIDHVSQCFRYWSGSLKYKFYIYSSPFASARIVFYYSPSGGGLDWQSCYHTLVDVEGDTEVEFSIPYMHPYPMTSSAVGAIRASVISISKPADATTYPIYVNCYVAGGTDYQFCRPWSMEMTLQCNPRADFEKDFIPLHPSMKAYHTEKLVSGEEVTTFRDLAHMSTPIKALDSGGSFINVYTGLGNRGNKDYIGLEAIGIIYKYWRGSITYRCVLKDPTAPSLIQKTSSNPDFFPFFAISSPTNPVAEATCPYYADRYFITTQHNYSDRIYYSSTSTAYAFTNAADDFSFHFLRGPATAITYDHSGTNTTEALYTWFSS